MSQEDEKVNCSICLEELNDGKEKYELACHHLYHKECIQKWLSNHTTCPLCRFHVDPMRPEYVEDDIFSEDRRDEIRTEIERLKTITQLGGFGIELIMAGIFPGSMRKGFGRTLSSTVNSGRLDPVFDTVARSENGVIKWVLLGITVFISALIYNLSDRR